MQQLGSLAPLLDKYNTFLVDLWGVIHDGWSLYPGVVKTLQKLQSAEKQVIFLSNSPRRAEFVMGGLDRFGISRSLYQTCVTSGEVTFSILQDAQTDETIKYYYIGTDNPAERGLLLGLNYVETQDINQAQFVFATGFGQDGDVLYTATPQLDKCLAAGIPMYCPNPDRVIVRQTGEKRLCAGVMGDYYRQQGGEVIFVGKPYANVYNRCFDIIGNAVDKSKIAMIGDNLDTDVQGANKAGITSIFVAGGILKQQIAEKGIEAIIPSKVKTPDYVVPGLLV